MRSSSVRVCTRRRHSATRSNHQAIHNVSRSVLGEFVRVLYQLKHMHMVVAGVGFEHARLEQLAAQVFESENWKPGWARTCTRGCICASWIMWRDEIIAVADEQSYAAVHGRGHAEARGCQDGHQESMFWLTGCASVPYAVVR